MNFVELLNERVNEAPENIAIKFRNKKVFIDKTWTDLYNGVISGKKYFDSLQEKRVALLGETSWKWICLAYGAVVAGKTLILMDPALDSEAMENLLKKVDTECIVSQKVVNLECGIANYVYSDLELPEADCLVSPLDGPGATLGEVVIFTSGTTNSAKAVVLTFEKLCGFNELLVKKVGMEKRNVCIIPIPLHHIFGLATLTGFLYENMILMISNVKDLAMDFRYVTPYGIMMVTAMIDAFLSRDMLDGVKIIFHGGSACPQELADKMTAKGIRLVSYYGMSEMCGGVAFSSNDDVKAYEVLTPMEIHLAEDGEIVVKNEYAFLEYYKNPEATAEALQEDGYHTGDYGMFDENGRLHIGGRKNAIAVLPSGEKLFLTDIENHFMDTEGVGNVMVFYVKDTLTAVFEGEGKDEEYANWITGLVNEYNDTKPMGHRIRKTWIYDKAFPLTSSGKLHRKAMEISCTEYLN